MTEKFLNLFERHSAFEQQGSDRVPEQVRMNFLFDIRLFRRFFNDLLNAPGGEFRVSDAFKDITALARTEMSFQLLRQFGQNRNLTAFTAFSFFIQNHLFVEEKVFNFGRLSIIIAECRKPNLRKPEILAR
jgi:hypothetical protein